MLTPDNLTNSLSPPKGVANPDVPGSAKPP
jgi:hypothetical protein